MPEAPSETTPAERFEDFVGELQAQGKRVELVHAQPLQRLEDLAEQLGCRVEDIHKTVCLNYKDENGRHLVAVIVPVTARVEMEKVARQLGLDPKKVKSAQPDFIEQETGFKPGGIPPIGFEVTRLVQNQVLGREFIIAGGGNNLNAYTKMDPSLLRELYPDIIEGDFVE